MNALANRNILRGPAPSTTQDTAVYSGSNDVASGCGSGDDKPDGMALAKNKRKADTSTASSISQDRDGKGPVSVCSGAYVPLHALLFILGDLHIKTPKEILEKVRDTQLSTWWCNG